MQQELVLIFDFGSQFAQLIARRVRELNVFCQIVRHDLPAARVAELKPSGLIFSGGPMSVYERGAPLCDSAIFDLKIPVLGICYGLQVAAQGLGGGVDSSGTAALLRRAVGDRLVCIFVDNGLLRLNELEAVKKTFQGAFGIELHTVDAAQRFLKALDGVTDPQKKRTIIGHTF